VFGVMMPLLAADLTRGTSHFNLCMGSLGLAMYLGAALSTTLGGWIADGASLQLAFGALATVGLLATLTMWWAMPETHTE
jgi:MFS family permease